MTTLPRPYAALSTKHFCEQSHSHQKRTQKRKLTIFGNTKQVIQDYDTVFDNSIPLRKNDLLRITYFRIPPAFVPWNQPPEANVKWFSVASPGPAGNFTTGARGP